MKKLKVWMIGVSLASAGISAQGFASDSDPEEPVKGLRCFSGYHIPDYPGDLRNLLEGPGLMNPFDERGNTSLDSAQATATDSVITLKAAAETFMGKTIGQVSVTVMGLNRTEIVKQDLGGVIDREVPLATKIEGLKGKTPQGYEFDGVFVFCNLE